MPVATIDGTALQFTESERLLDFLKRTGAEHQKIPWKPKPYAVDTSNPYRYDPDQCILCGRCVEACQNVQVNETLSIDWTSPNPRVLCDGGAPIGESSCVSCGHCSTVCPCNALMENSMHPRQNARLDQPPIDAEHRSRGQGDAGQREKAGHRTAWLVFPAQPVPSKGATPQRGAHQPIS